MPSLLVLYERCFVSEDAITIVTEGDDFLLSLFLFPNHNFL